jgi:hypothetical protein
MKHVWIAALILSGACASPPAPGLAAAEEKKVCRDEPKLGSLMPVRLCETQAFWDELEARREAGVRDAARHVHSRSNTNMRGNDRPM